MEFSNLAVSYEIRQQLVTGIAVSYAITAEVAEEASLGIVYEIASTTSATERDRFIGTWADNTQVACNLLPDWHSGRKYGKASHYQQLLNSTTQAIDDIQFKMIRGRRNLHLYTAETREISKVFRTSVSGRPKTTPSKNLLRNADFSLKRPALLDNPMRWSTSGTTGKISYADDSLFGGSSIELRAEAGERCRLSQSVTLTEEPLTPLTASVWIKTPLEASVAASETASTSTAHIQLSILKMDGTPTSTQVALPVTTNGSWQRVSATLIPSSDIYSASIKLEIDATNATRTHLSYVGGLQLEAGKSSTSWQAGDSDIPQWINNSSGTPYNAVAFGASVSKQETIGGQAVVWDQISGRRAFFVESEDEFLSLNIPTSISSIEESPATTPQSTSEVAMGSYHEWTDKRSFSTSYEVDATNSATINRILRETGEHYQQFKMTERGIFSDDKYVDLSLHLADNGTYLAEIRAICILNGNLLALTKESYTPNGGTQEVVWAIKVISLQQTPGIDELQVLTDLKIPSTTDLTLIESLNDPFNYLGIESGNITTLVIATSGSTPMYIKLNVGYDYYTVDLRRGQLVTRENYAGNLVIT